jgi:hypothetical protein
VPSNSLPRCLRKIRVSPSLISHTARNPPLPNAHVRAPQDLVGAYQGEQQHESIQQETDPQKHSEQPLGASAASALRPDAIGLGHARKPFLPPLNELEEYPQGAPTEIKPIEDTDITAVSRQVQLPVEMTAQEVEARWVPRPVLSVSQREHEGVVLRRRGDPHTSIFTRSETSAPRDVRAGCFPSLFFWGWRLVARAGHEALRDGEAMEIPAVRSTDEWIKVLNFELEKRRSSKSKALDADAVEAAVVATVRNGTRGVAWLLLTCWMVISMACIVLCIRELLVWVGDCPAFALAQDLQACLTGIKVARRALWEGAVMCVSVFVAMGLQSLAFNYYLHLCTLGATGASSALMSMLYTRALRSMDYGKSVWHVCVCDRVWIDCVCKRSWCSHQHFVKEWCREADIDVSYCGVQESSTTRNLSSPESLLTLFQSHVSWANLS